MATLNKNFLDWLKINDRIIVINYKISLNELISFLGSTKHSFVVEYNTIVISNSTYKTKIISSLDKIEFVTIVGGG